MVPWFLHYWTPRLKKIAKTSFVSKTICTDIASNNRDHVKISYLRYPIWFILTLHTARSMTVNTPTPLGILWAPWMEPLVPRLLFSFSSIIDIAIRTTCICYGLAGYLFLPAASLMWSLSVGKSIFYEHTTITQYGVTLWVRILLFPQNLKSSGIVRSENSKPSYTVAVFLMGIVSYRSSSSLITLVTVRSIMQLLGHPVPVYIEMNSWCECVWVGVDCFDFLKEVQLNGARVGDPRFVTTMKIFIKHSHSPAPSLTCKNS